MLHLPISELIYAADENNETICDKSDCNYVSATNTFPVNMTVSAEGDVTQNSSLDYKEFYEVAQFITGLILYPIFCVFGLAGNILSIVVLKGRKMPSTNLFLIALSISDGAKLINDFFYFIVTLLLNTSPENGKLAFGYLYPYAHYLFNVSICITAWLTVSVAAERYILVCHATKAKQMCTFNRAMFTITVVFVSMILLTIPSALRYQTVWQRINHTSSDGVTSKKETYQINLQVSSLWQNDQFAIGYSWVLNILRSIVPLVLLITLNCFIVHALHKTRRSTRQKLQPRQRITFMLVSVIVVFIICVTPDAVMSTVFKFGYYESSYLVRGIREITDFLLTVNSATNFILYCAFNSVFRHRFWSLCVSGNRRNLSPSIDAYVAQSNVDEPVILLNSRVTGNGLSV